MKFIHTGDICWGYAPDAGTRWSRERSRDIRETFADIVGRARDTSADFLFISGNLFAGQPLSSDLRDVNAILASAPRLRTVIIAGTRDRITPSSAFHGFSWAPNVTFLYPDSTVYFEDLHTEVTGISLSEDQADVTIPPVSDDGRIRILLECGEEESSLPVSPENSPYAYIALGGRRRREVLSGGRAAFCGGPEPLSREDTGDYGIYCGEIGADGGLISLQFTPMQKAQYISLTARVTPATTARELEDALGEEIRKKGTDNIYLIRILGKRHPDEVFTFDMLQLRYRILDVEDLSEPQYDMSALFAEHPGDMIGFYIRAMQKPDMSPVEKKALYDGIRALLLSREKDGGAERGDLHALS
ncbi:MAG: metallophosphoesterase [Clostridium sp.]|nr:metallophosphoesterase [Clostridium sp.]